MPYSAEISRRNPTCFVFLIDHSSSMARPFAGREDKTKAQGVAETVNKLLMSLILKTSGEAIQNRFHVGVIGYGAEVTPAWQGALAGQTLVPASDLGMRPSRLEEVREWIDDGRGGRVEKVVRRPIWFEPLANGKTPMCEALRLTTETVAGFLMEYPDCYPPIVINITDGMANDGDPREPARELTKLRSSDGSVLLFNIHVSETAATPITFPADESGFEDKFAKLLFRMSSRLPDRMLAHAGSVVSPGARGFAFNADMGSLVQFLDIGTRVEARS